MSESPTMEREVEELSDMQDHQDVNQPAQSVDCDGDNTLSTQSLVSVSLSDADVPADSEACVDDEAPRPSSDTIVTLERPASVESRSEEQSRDEDLPAGTKRTSNQSLTIITEGLSGVSADTTPASGESASARSRSSSAGSEGSVQVNWEELHKTEESEARDEGSDESTAFLLARLEQENNALATDPKAGITTRARRFSRPPSMNHIKRLVKGPEASSLRYSMLPSPPPMTELEFWAALVKNYRQTAQRLPTLTANKIRAGIPPPLRGVVWVSMAGARERTLEEAFDRLVGESSPYDNIIGKDIGRSFPGVDMFRDPEGEGQKMLGRVLKCFSLYDDKIGYCQGLGFLVGPLLMQMGDREAFCVLVRLMEDYGLRSCFLPDLSGLHLRIYQFQRLLRQHMPKLADHLESLQVEAAYLSQWFLSFFAVTCPLPMLFRIYDVILAEGASETIMRVALSVMQRNEKKIMASTEFEDVMQLLLSRALWDPYGCNTQSADELVNDFVSFTGVVTRESLQSLETSFKEAQADDTATRPAVQPAVQTAASRFVDRLWFRTQSSHPKSASLSPPLSGPSRPFSLLHRTTSKQSLASTLSSAEGSSGSSTSIASTAFTEETAISRELSTDSLSIKTTETSSTAPTLAVSRKDRDLYGQIEDLLTALSEMQREHALLAAQLQKEREERTEDHRAFRGLVDRLKEVPIRSDQQSLRRSVPVTSLLANPEAASSQSWSAEEIQRLVTKADSRLATSQNHRRTASLETKQQVRDSLARAKEQLRLESTRSQDLSQRLSEQERETAQAREQLREARSRIQDNLREKQRLEKTIHDLRSANKASYESSEHGSADSPDYFSLRRSDSADSGPTPSSNGLRELKLGRSTTQPPKTHTPSSSVAHAKPHPPQYSKRTSSLSTQAVLTSTDNHAPVPHDVLLLELVNAKTAEAVARQELEEFKAKYDMLRKSAGLSLSVATASALAAPVAGAGAAKSPSPVDPASAASGKTHASTPSVSSGLGFWGWGKRSVSHNTSPAS